MVDHHVDEVEYREYVMNTGRMLRKGWFWERLEQPLELPDGSVHKYIWFSEDRSKWFTGDQTSMAPLEAIEYCIENDLIKEFVSQERYDEDEEYVDEDS